MKKSILILFSAMILLSCGSSAVVKEARSTISGDWTLTNITYPGNDLDVNVRLFEGTTAQCLENSSWNFISNNNTGSYLVNNPVCGSSTEFFMWSVEEGGTTGENYDFMLKPTDADYRSVGSNQGFRINLVSLNQETMVWEQTVNFEGSPFTIRMNFNKN